MTDLTRDQLIRDIARDVVGQIAPQELPLFRATSEAYFKNPREVLEGKKPRDETLGFGLETAVAFLTPVVLAVATEVVKFVAERIKESLKEEGAGIVTELIKKMFKRFRSTGEERGKAPALAPLSPEQLAQVRQRAIEKACQLNLPEVQARLLADAIVGSLAVIDS